MDNPEATTTQVPRAGENESRESFRRGVLVSLGATGGEVDLLLRYGFSRFAGRAIPPLPLPDEPFVSAWREYAGEAAGRGAMAVLREKLVQLRFPIRAGISGEEGYRAATLRGGPCDAEGEGVGLVDPEGVTLSLCQTPAGTIPALTVRERRDFIALVRALSMRNEPGPVPESMGAATITGLNNWDRIGRYRSAWEADQPAVAALGGWPAEFAHLVPHRELYQDRLIVLGEGGYSGVAAKCLGMTDEVCQEASLVIRREHECFHYFTKRAFGTMKNAVYDELLADVAGIAAAAGRFRADWFLVFMGLENFPRYRDGGRLQNYLGDWQPGVRGFAILQRLVTAAAENIERFENGMRADRGTAAPGHTAMLLALASLHLEELASADAGRLIAEKLQALCHEPL